MKTQVHFSSASFEWSTPGALFDAINGVCGFELDVCATPENAKCAKYYTIADNGLLQPWDGMCWMNPPYGRTIADWMCRAYQESRKPGTVVVCLVPARTDTEWWHRYAMAGNILYLRGRLKFGGHKNSAPFPSAIVQLGGNMALWSRLQQQLTAQGMPCG